MHNSLQTRLLKRLMRPAAKKWIVGERLADAVAAAKKLNRAGARVMINYIGEDVKSDAESKRNFSEYFRISKAISSNHLDADMTIKLTQFCLARDKKCLGNIARLLDDAKKKKVFVWFDMENAKYTDYIVDTYLHFLRTNKNLGVCLQASLIRTKKDVTRILAKKGTIRLVKGAYHESPDIAYTSHEDIMRSYFALMKVLFLRGRKFALGTHDEKIINAALAMNRGRKVVEFQTLNGIRKDLVERLLSSNQRVSIYMPYGTEWLHYGLRRVRERKRNILLLLK